MKLQTTMSLTDKSGVPFTNGMGGSPVTLREVISSSLNAPAQTLGNPDNIHPRHLAEMRSRILDKLEESETEFTPQEEQEILNCVSLIQSVTLYAATKRALQTSGITDVAPEPEMAKAVSGAPDRN